MCRLAAYLGQPLLLKDLILEPEHSLYVQSWQPKELKYAKLNADGFGFGWYHSDGRVAVYRNPMPIWADANLGCLTETLSSTLWLAMVRSATPGYGVDLINTQPFYHKHYLCLHNGYIKNFNQSLRQTLLKKLSAETEATIQGRTDSEYLFALLLQLINDYPQDEMTEHLKRLVAWVSSAVTENEALLNFIISDGQALYAVRHAINGEAPSLYYYFDNQQYLIASERFNQNPDWHALETGQLMVARQAQSPQLIQL